MISNDTILEFRLVSRNLFISRARYESAKRNASDFSDADIEKLRVELEVDSTEFERIKAQLISDISDIPDTFVRGLAEDHYLRGDTVSTLATRYGYSDDTIKRYLRKSRCS